MTNHGNVEVKRRKAGRWRLAPALALGLSAFAAQGLAFTQGIDGVTPQGHEWITGCAAWGFSREAVHLQLPPELVPLFRQRISGAHDPASCGPSTPAAEAAILGQRWVDFGGFNPLETTSDTQVDCWSAVVGLPDDLQHDHFLRGRNDRGGAGAVAALKDSIRRFETYFVNAAIAPGGDVSLMDRSVAPMERKADRRFFLFGRALHLLQDSFSLDHAVRSPEDGFRKVRGIKSFLCTIGSDQHAHVRPLIHDPGVEYPAVADIIWMSRDRGADRSNVKLNALAAVDATRDAWAAFVRVLGQPLAKREEAARREARLFSKQWLSFDESEVRRRYDDPEAPVKLPTFVKDESAQRECDWKAKLEPMEKIERDRRLCLHGVQPARGPREWDAALKLPYRWERKYPPLPGEKGFACMNGVVEESTAPAPGVHFGYVTPGMSTDPKVGATFDFAGLLRDMSGYSVDLNNAWNKYTVGTPRELVDCAEAPDLAGNSNFVHPLCKLANAWFGVYTISDDTKASAFLLREANHPPGIHNLRPEAMVKLTELDQKLTVCVTHWGQKGYTRQILDAEFRFDATLDRPEVVELGGRTWLRQGFTAWTTAALPDTSRVAIPEGWFTSHVGLPSPDVYRYVDPWYRVALTGETLGTYVECPRGRGNFWAVIYYNGAQLEPKVGPPRRNWTDSNLRDELRKMAAAVTLDCRR